MYGLFKDFIDGFNVFDIFSKHCISMMEQSIKAVALIDDLINTPEVAAKLRELEEKARHNEAIIVAKKAITGIYGNSTIDISDTNLDI